MTDLSSPVVSVVIPALNEERFLGACLESVTSQTFDAIEVLVVDGGSTDGTVRLVGEVAKRDRRVRLVANPARIIPAGLNAGLREAKGKWLVRVDAHSTVPPDYVERAVKHLETGRWGGVGGRKDGVGFTPSGRAIAAAMASPFGVGGSTYHHGTEPQVVDHVPFGAYPVDLARALGGWDERLRVNQDFEFDYRVRAAGRQLLFDPELRIDWICRQSVRELFAQYVRYGRGKAKVAAMYRRSISLRHVAPPLFVAYLLASALVAVFRPRLAACALAPYVAFIALATISTARAVRRRDAIYLPLAFVAMHVGWGYGFWRGALDLVRSKAS